jgi:hypothetical protein
VGGPDNDVITVVVGATGQLGSLVVGLGVPDLRTVEEILRERAALQPVG